MRRGRRDRVSAKAWERRDVQYVFRDGWTVERVDTLADTLREGQLMQNCLASNWTFHLDAPDVVELFSLRDPHGVPHLGIFVLCEDGGRRVSHLEGRCNTRPKSDYERMAGEFAVATGLGFDLDELHDPLRFGQTEFAAAWRLGCSAA
jgi:hypothetical protein